MVLNTARGKHFAGQGRRIVSLPAIAGLSFAVAFALAHGLYFFHFLVDDAFIPLQYAKNLAKGLGPVYNAGEYVEGYSDFLWIVLLTPFHWLSLDALQAAKVLGIALIVPTVLIVYVLGSAIVRERNSAGSRPGACWIRFTGPLLLSTNGAYALWSASGLESSLVALLIVAAAWFYLRELHTPNPFPVSAVAFALLAMSRPEGWLPFAIALLDQIWRRWRREGGSGFTRRQALRWLATFLAIFLPYFVWRFAYYGYPVANTVYAKTGGGYAQHAAFGIYYAYQFLTSAAGIAVFLLPILFSRLTQSTRYLLLLAGGYGGFVVLAGGDWMPLFRFFVPILPIVFVLVQASLDRLVSALSSMEPAVREETGAMPRVSHGGAILLIVMALIGVSLFASYEAADGTKMTRAIASNAGSRAFAGWLAENAKPGDSIATVDAGGVGYYSDLRVIDMIGLLDEHIAHLPPRSGARGGASAGFGKWDTAYVLSQKPTFVAMHVLALPSDGHRGRTDWAGTDELINEPEFLQSYEPVPESPGLFRRTAGSSS